MSTEEFEKDRSATAAISRTGRRGNNQDRSIVREWEGAPTRLLAAVADGMGGGFAGEEAAQIAIDTLVEALEGLDHPAWGDDEEAALDSLQSLAFSAHEKIEKKSQEIAGGGLMGTTLTAAILQGERLRILHIGDTRLYLVREGEFKQLTRDHRPDPELGIPDNVITRCLGCKQSEVDTAAESISADTVILVSSDGFFAPLDTEDIMERLFKRPSLEESLSDLATLAYNKGSEDNISAAAIEVGELPRSEDQLGPVTELEDSEVHAEKEPQASALPFWLVLVMATFAVFSVFLFLFSISTNPQSKALSPDGDAIPKEDIAVKIEPPPPGPALRISQIDITKYPPWIRAYFVVLDEQGDLIKDIKKEEITLREDEQMVPAPAWEMKRVYSEDNALGLVMAMDVSGSMMNEPVAHARKAGISLVKTLKPNDVVTLLAFGESVSRILDGESASHKQKIVDSFASLKSKPKAKTSLYQAISLGLSILDKMETRQKALVVLSDGQDTISPEAKRMETLEKARNSGYPVYTVGLFNKSLDKEYLITLAGESKGRYLEAPHPDRLINCFDVLARELTKGYIAEHKVVGDEMLATKRLHMEFFRPGLSLSAHRIYSTPYDVDNKPPSELPSKPSKEGPAYVQAVLLMVVGGLVVSLITLLFMIIAARKKNFRKAALAYVLIISFMCGAFLLGALLRFSGLLL